mmetsp:Transcript_35578/g.33743  ORF Transcript_35578/g.33743 Transcript_35578/m.33743 type:complete len:144 (+) Transcript_35578:19-450(+)
MVVIFAIVGKAEPLYEAEIVPASSGSGEEELAYLHQFILHASLDMVQTAMWSNNSTFLRVVDRFNSLLVSAFITPGGTVMLLLHNGRAPEESVRSFFTEASELFARHILNPFAILDAPMTMTNGCSSLFDANVRSIAKRTLLL